jgi:hypothetical protein
MNDLGTDHQLDDARYSESENSSSRRSLASDAERSLIHTLPNCFAGCCDTGDMVAVLELVGPRHGSGA